MLSSEPLPAPTADAARPLLLQLLREKGLRRALFGGDAAGKAHPALEPGPSPSPTPYPYPNPNPNPNPNPYPDPNPNPNPSKAHPALELIARVRLLRALAPEEGWPRCAWRGLGLGCRV